MPDVSEILRTYNYYVSTKLTLGVMGLKITTLARACEPHIHC